MRAKKVDLTQASIVSALRKAGCEVLSLASVGRGCPDLLINRRGRLILLECKTGKGRITEDQEEFWTRWPVMIVRTPDEAMKAVGLMQ